MPDNPVVKNLTSRAAQVKDAQDKLRAAMADVAVKKVTRPAEPPSAPKQS